MGKRKMGRYWSSEEEWKISTMREVKRLKESVRGKSDEFEEFVP